MQELRLTLAGAGQLQSATRAARANDIGAAMQALDAFLAGRAATHGLATDTILSKGGATNRLFARLTSQLGEARFLRATPRTSELVFFRHCDAMSAALAAEGIHIVSPEVAFSGLGTLAFLAPYHDFMTDRRSPNDPVAFAASVARLNAAGRLLPREVHGSTQQRRTANLPNLLRRTVLSVPFLRNEADVLPRTVAAIRGYRRALRGAPKVFCHGDIAIHNVFVNEGETYFIDFENYLFAEPGLDLAKIYGGDDAHLDEICAAYADAGGFDADRADIRLAAIYGYFLVKLKRASKGRDRADFRKALARLEGELASR